MSNMIIDTHAHLWPDNYLDRLEELGSPDISIAKQMNASDSLDDLKHRFNNMKSAGVDRQILSATPQSPQWGSPQESLESAMFINNSYYELIKKYPNHFHAYGAVPLPNVEEAISEGKRAIEELGFLGIGVNTLIQNKIPITDEQFYPFFEAMDKLNTVIYIHPTGCGALTPLVNDYDLEWVVGAPIEDMLVTLQLLKSNIPQKFPNIKFHIAHLGGGISFQMQRIMDNYSDWDAFSENPLNILKSNFWFDTANFLEGALMNSAEVLGSNRLLMGSDFPYFMDDKYTRAVDYIYNSRLNSEEKENILSKNALNLYQKSASFDTEA